MWLSGFDYGIFLVRKTFFPCTLRLVRCFQFKGMMENMTAKIPILILFLFCLLCGLKNHSFWVLSLLQLQVVLMAVLIIQALVARWFQVSLDGFSSFQMVLGRFRGCFLDRFKVNLARPSDGFSSFQMVLVRFRSSQLVPHFSKYTSFPLFNLSHYFDVLF